MNNQPIDIVFSFDTTGSMYPALAEVRRRVSATAKALFESIPNLRIGIIAHGDYCDAGSTYVTKHLDLTDFPNAVAHFINNVERTGGGDAPECYELVLQEARTRQNWRPGSKRVLVMIGDDVPHAPAHNPGRIDWRQELEKLADEGVLVHGVQALSSHRSHARVFYSDLARLSGGFYLQLDQFGEATELLMAVAYQQQGGEALRAYEESLVSDGKMTRSLASIFDTLSRRDPRTGRFKKPEHKAVSPDRFQQVYVDRDQPIKELVESIGAEFKKGRGFYEFTKPEKIQDYKEIIIRDRATGDMYSGGEANEILGLTSLGGGRVSPSFDSKKYAVFVQSTSNNRKLIGGTIFLYEAS